MGKIISITGIINSTSNLIGQLRLIQSITGLIESHSSLSGEISKLIFVNGLIESTSELEANLRLHQALTGFINSVSELEGKLSAHYTLTGLIESYSSLIGKLYKEVVAIDAKITPMIPETMVATQKTSAKLSTLRMEVGITGSLLQNYAKITIIRTNTIIEEER